MLHNASYYHLVSLTVECKVLYVTMKWQLPPWWGVRVSVGGENAVEGGKRSDIILMTLKIFIVSIK